MKLRLKPFKQDNQFFIWNIYVKAMKPHIENIWGWDLEWQQNDFAKALTKFNTDLIMLGETKVGYVQYLTLTKSIYINALMLNPNFQSQGIGVRIIEKMASKNPELPIELRCFCVNIEALNFYLKNGFEIVKQDSEFFILRKSNHLL